MCPVLQKNMNQIEQRLKEDTNYPRAFPKHHLALYTSLMSTAAKCHLRHSCINLYATRPEHNIGLCLSMFIRLSAGHLHRA